MTRLRKKEIKMEKLFEALDENDVLREGRVITPTQETVVNGQEVYNKAFRDALDSGTLLTARFAKVLEEQGLWSESKDKRITTLFLLIKKYENKLADKKQSEEEAQAHAIKVREFRKELNELSEVQSSFSNQTAEGQADDERYNYYCTQCILDKTTNKPYYTDTKDFIKRSGSDFGNEGVQLFGYMLHNVDVNYQEKLPEEIFFKRFGEPTADLTEADIEIQSLIDGLVKDGDEADSVDMETIEYGFVEPKPVVKKKASRKKKKVAAVAESTE